MENTKTPRITKTMKYADITAMLKGEEAKHITVAEAIEFINSEMEILARKTANKSAKPTAKQMENENFIVRLLELLDTHDKLSCTDILPLMPELESTQKVSSLMRKIVKELYPNAYGETKIKGRTYFHKL